MIEMAEMVEPSNKCQTPYPSVLDFWKIKFKNQVRQTGFFTCKNRFRNWYPFNNEVVLPKK